MDLPQFTVVFFGTTGILYAILRHVLTFSDMLRFGTFIDGNLGIRVSVSLLYFAVLAESFQPVASGNSAIIIAVIGGASLVGYDMLVCLFFNRVREKILIMFEKIEEAAEENAERTQ